MQVVKGLTSQDGQVVFRQNALAFDAPNSIAKPIARRITHALRRIILQGTLSRARDLVIGRTSLVSVASTPTTIPASIREKLCLHRALLATSTPIDRWHPSCGLVAATS
jgi:hypothetical protein